MSTTHKARNIGTLVAVLAGTLFISVAHATPMGQAAANQVDLRSYQQFMSDELYTHVGDDRGINGPEHDLAQANIAAIFQSYGLTVTLEPFLYSGATYYNVVGTKTGTVLPNEEYVFGAHYDSVSNPGADDDASGVALLLEAARIVSQYDSEYTIRFIAFDREEQGLVGSTAYVADHAGDQILGMVQADMVAYDPSTGHARIYGNSTSNALKTALGAAVIEYGDGLTSADYGWNGQSDHAPFDAAGYQACLFIEGEVWNNPFYHTQQDTLEQLGNINFAYAVKMTRSVVGFMVDAAAVIVADDYLAFSYPNGRPSWIGPGGGATVRVEVSGVGNAVPQSGTGVLHCDDGNGWQSVAMIEVSPNVYDAVFPALACGQEVRYYTSAQAVGGQTYSNPWYAPGSAFSAMVGNGVTVLSSDNFETNQGWTTVNLGATSGDWQRGIPVIDPSWGYAPTSDSDGSGQCFLTQNQMGNTDVDDGAVRLLSPLMDLTGGGTIGYDYFLRLTDTAGGVDRLLVEIDGNSGLGPWTEIARHDTNGGLAWRHHEISPADLAAAGVVPTATMQLRFTVNDTNPQSIVEGGLDAFSITMVDCCTTADGDMDNSGAVNGEDLRLFVEAAMGTPSMAALCHGDFNDDGILAADDIPQLVAACLAP